MNKNIDTQDAPVFSYPLASGDLRYIEIGERKIYLRDEEGKGMIFRGEIAEIGAESEINLSEILLEYAMSCEGCSRAELAAEMLINFGEQLSQIYIGKTSKDTANRSPEDKITAAITCILNSMDVTYKQEVQADSIAYSLECCPLSECAQATGLNRSVEMAYLSLVTLFNNMIGRLSPEWTLLHPSGVEIDIPMHQVSLTR